MVMSLSFQGGRISLNSMKRVCTLEAELSLLLRVSHKYGKSGAQVLFSMGLLEHIASCKALNLQAKVCYLFLFSLVCVWGPLPSLHNRPENDHILFVRELYGVLILRLEDIWPLMLMNSVWSLHQYWDWCFLWRHWLIHLSSLRLDYFADCCIEHLFSVDTCI